MYRFTRYFSMIAPLFMGFLFSLGEGQRETEIQWMGPQIMVSTDDLIDREGTVIEAVNLGGDAPLAVNDIVFIPGTGSMMNGLGRYSDAGVAGTPTSDENMNTILSSFRFAKGDDAAFLKWTDLTIGQQYKIQLFCVDNRRISWEQLLAAVDRNRGGVVDWDCSNFGTGRATYLTGRFTASQTSLRIDLEATKDGEYDGTEGFLNAYILVELDAAAGGTIETILPSETRYTGGKNEGIDVEYYPSQKLIAHPERNASLKESYFWVEGMLDPVADYYSVGESYDELRLIEGKEANAQFGYFDNINAVRPQPSRPELTFRQSGVLTPFKPLFSFRFGVRPDLAHLLPGVALDNEISWMRDWTLEEYQVFPARTVYRLSSADGLGAVVEVLPAVSIDGAGMVGKIELTNQSGEEQQPVLILGGYQAAPSLPTSLPENDDALEISCLDAFPKPPRASNLDTNSYTMLAAFDGGSSQQGLTLQPAETANVFFLALLDAPDDVDPVLVNQVRDYFERNEDIPAPAQTALIDTALNTYLYCTATGDDKFNLSITNVSTVFAQSSVICSNGIYRSSPVRIQLPNRKLTAYLNYSARDLLPSLVQAPGFFHDAKYYPIWQYIFAYRHQQAAMNLGMEKEAIDDHLMKGCNQQADGRLKTVSGDFKRSEHPTSFEASYIDNVYHYWKWTGDFTPVSNLWPVMVKAMGYNEKMLNADGDHLYLDFLHQWKSDGDGRGPDSLFQSALVWRNYAAMAEFAAEMGNQNAANEYSSKADSIYEAIHRELWSPQDVMFGSKGPLGMLRLHPECLEVEIPVRTGVLDQWQAYVMTDWFLHHNTLEDADQNLWVAQSDWWPRVWSHGLNAVSDGVMIGMTAFQSGHFEEGARILNTYALPAYKRAGPGDHYTINPQSIGTRVGSGTSYATCQGAWGKAVVEGVFGVEPHMDDNYIVVSPNFPDYWESALFERPGLSVQFERKGSTNQWNVVTDNGVSAHLELPVFSPVKSLRIDGQPASYTNITAGMGCGRLMFDTPSGATELLVEYESADRHIEKSGNQPLEVGGSCEIMIQNLDDISVDDHFSFFTNILINTDRITMNLAKPGCGRATVFLNCRKGNMRWIEPVVFDTRSDPEMVETVNAPLDKNSKLIQIDLSGSYNENINTYFYYPWEWDQKHFGAGGRGTDEMITYWHHRPFMMDTPWPAQLEVAGIPFKTGSGSLEGTHLSIIANTLPRELPTGFSVDVGKKVNKFYLLSLNFMLTQKSYVPAVQINLTYTDGSRESHELVAPYNFDHFAQISGINTREYMLGGARPLPGHLPFRDIMSDIHLTMTDVICDEKKVLESIEFKSIATETFFGLVGLTLNVPEEQ